MFISRVPLHCDLPKLRKNFGSAQSFHTRKFGETSEFYPMLFYPPGSFVIVKITRFTAMCLTATMQMRKNGKFHKTSKSI